MKVKPTDSWVNVIEKRYNDDTIRPTEALVHLLDESISSKSPPIYYAVVRTLEPYGMNLVLYRHFRLQNIRRMAKTIPMSSKLWIRRLEEDFIS